MLDIFWKFIQFKLRSSWEIHFWEDRWIGEALLRESFRTLYSLAVDHKGRVMDSLDDVQNI